jgi:hypothetical protein
MSEYIRAVFVKRIESETRKMEKIYFTFEATGLDEIRTPIMNIRVDKNTKRQVRLTRDDIVDLINNAARFLGEIK